MLEQGVKCLKLIIKTAEQRYWRRSGVFIVNFEHISYLVLVFVLFTLNMQLPAGIVLGINCNSQQAFTCSKATIETIKMV